MARDDDQLNAAKRAYRTAAEVGNREEEARWANVIGNILKNRGEYVKALKWLRIDYDVSVKFLPQKQSLATCQSLGEVHLRLFHFEDALKYQKMHLELAKDADDIIEQQRANTQLGRTYHEIYLKSEDHGSVRNAKKYFKSALELSQILKENPPTNKSSFLKEYIDAHNNIGLLEMDLDNYGEAEKILSKGLKLCDEEEVTENDDARSRLHHNLGNVYLEMRSWDEAAKHIRKDIQICKDIKHFQGEAKGFINLGELHYRIQKYDDAIRCYKRALNLAKSMEDEHALAEQIYQNIATVKQAVKVMEELKNEEQNFKKVRRNAENAIGKAWERKSLLQQIKSLDCLIDKSSMILAWDQHCKYAKCKKKIAEQLLDKEKLGDSFLVLGESYLKLRNFNKALKWVTKGLGTYQEIRNLEGQALAKNIIGDILDSDGKWLEALNAFKESYRIAADANLPSIQLSALENMHYSYMIRFDDVTQARRLQCEISNLKHSKKLELETVNLARDYCSETDTDGGGPLSNDGPDNFYSPDTSTSSSENSRDANGLEEFDDDVPLIPFVQSHKHSSQKQTVDTENCNDYTNFVEASPKCLPKTCNQQTVVGRKRPRVIFSDDEDEMNDAHCPGRSIGRCSVPQNIATSDLSKIKNNDATSLEKFEDFSRIEFKCVPSSYNCSADNNWFYKSPKSVIQIEKSLKSLSADEGSTCSNKHPRGCKSLSADEGSTEVKYTDAVLKVLRFTSNHEQCISFRIDDIKIDVERGSFLAANEMSIESLKVELACLYFVHLPADKRAKGLLPLIQHMMYDGNILESLEASGNLVNDSESVVIEVSISGWIQRRLMKLYIDFCQELSETTSLILLKKLFISEVEDELVVSECGLPEPSFAPLLDALRAHKTVSMIDLSHNRLGCNTMDKLQNFFMSSQRYNGLTLDLHCNKFGPSTLSQLFECPLLFARLEVLNISGNHLGGGCGQFLSTLFDKCRALYSLDIARCCISPTAIEQMANAIPFGSVLSHLSIGYNNLFGKDITLLLTKLASLERFSELNISGIEVNEAAIDGICQLAERTCLSRLMLGSTKLGNEGAVRITESLFSQCKEFVKLDLSNCGLTSIYIHKLNSCGNMVAGIVELNLEGNPFGEEGTSAITSLLTNPRCRLEVLILNECQLELSGLVQVIKALSENKHMVELRASDNITKNHKYFNYITSKSSEKKSRPVSIEQLEVADSEDELTGEEAKNVGSTKSAPEDCFIEELWTAIRLAKKLQLLDLSNNGVPIEVAQVLYGAWSSRSGCDRFSKHIKDQIIHFSSGGKPCCGLKPCCRRDYSFVLS